MKKLVFFCVLFLFSCQLFGYSSIPEHSNIPEYGEGASSIASYGVSDSYSNKNNEELNASKEGGANNSEVVYENENELLTQQYDELSSETVNNGLITSESLTAETPTYFGTIKLDDDGAGSSHGDRYHTNTTAFTVGGISLNADTDSYAVVPSRLLSQGVKVGDWAAVTIVLPQLQSDGSIIAGSNSMMFMVGDIGPENDEVGKISIKAAQDLGLGIQERANGNGPIPTNPLDPYDPDNDIRCAVTYYPAGSI